MLSDIQRSRIRAAFTVGKLKVRSVSPSGSMEWKRVVDVQRAEVPWETIYEVSSDLGSMVLTSGHRVFTSPVTKTETSKLCHGVRLLSVVGSLVSSSTVVSVQQIASRQFMYDLTAEDWHNFVLFRSKSVISNSPDKFYKFRPPAHEETVNQFSRVFGYIWEDAELLEYLERSLDMIIASPPRTPFNGIDQMTQIRPEWRTLLITGGMFWALQALQINWTADEFSYSIGGISLDLDKSSKYDTLKQGASDQFDKQLEKAKATVKFIKGLQQPKYGMGVRSAFGPFQSRGAISPRKFMGI